MALITEFKKGMNFDSMTKEHCENCVLENQDTTIEDMQSNLSAQIEEQKTPTLTSKTKSLVMPRKKLIRLLINK